MFLTSPSFSKLYIMGDMLRRERERNHELWRELAKCPDHRPYFWLGAEAEGV